MKNKTLPFFFMVLLALGLMGLIIVTQLFTNKSNKTLQDGNIQAVETFKINNRMQEVVNISFDLQSKLTNPTVLNNPDRWQSVSDSVSTLGFRANNLQKSISKLGYENHANEIDSIVKKQVNHSVYILVAAQNENIARRDSLANTLHLLQLGDKVYNSCLNIQKVLEESLEQTLEKNTLQANVLSTYNRVLAIVAIVAILIMAAIIIKRQAEQLKLIEELKAAEAAALKSKNAKNEFVANMSHELRTPLNALIGFGNLLSQTTLDDKQKEYVDVIRSGSYNLLNIVNDVLDLSKIEAGMLKIVNRPFSLVKVLENLEMMFSNTIEEKKLQYEWHADEKIPLNLKGDAERLKQILVNLIGNAIKFTTVGTIQIHVGILWVDEQTGMYKIGFTIKDTGAGIPKEKIKTIFERFEQLEHITTRQHGGTGLGLTIVKNLVEKMGGGIFVQSEVGVGSEFSFTCIFEKVAASPVTREENNVPGSLPLGKCRILAAEDNRANQTLLKHLLGKHEAILTIVDNGQDVINLLKENQYDLVLMDLQMPVMDGYTAIEKIKKEEHFAIPVIAMTAYVLEEEVKRCLEAGFDGYLPKPIEESALLQIISKHTKIDFVKTVDPQQNEFGFLKELVGDDPHALNEIVEEIKEQWSLDKTELEAAVNEKNNIEIKRVLHRVKSTFSPLGPNHEIYNKVAHQNSSFHEKERVVDSDEFKLLIAEIDDFTDNLQIV